MEDHVHDANGPDRSIRVLPVKEKIIHVLTLFLYVLLALDQKAAGANGWVVNLLSRSWLDELNE